MSEDREILREIWEGRLPVCFSVAPEDVYSVEQPDPFYSMVPRQSYFPLLTDKVQRHFSKFVTVDKETEMWLEYEGQPLKWHYPVGVLFDLLVTDTALPWNITVHFKDFPSDDLLFCHSKEVVEAHFMSVVKEADCLKHRCAVINNMQKKDHKQLWTSLCNDKFDQFWTINRKLMDNTGDLAFRSIPFRIYQVDKSPIQRLCPPLTEEGDQRTLDDLLQENVPDSFNDQETPPQVIIQGVPVPLYTNLAWLSTQFSHPDNFLHISLIDNPVT